MPKREPEQELDNRFEDTEHGELRSDTAANAGSNPQSPENIPRWRKIEIMRERAALREALGEDELDLEALEMEVFGSDEENQKLYKHGDSGEEEDEEVEFEDDGYEEDEFEEYDED